jgi:hypothetical protein
MVTAIDTDRLTLRNYRDRGAAMLLEYRAQMRVGDEGLEPPTSTV